MEPTVFISYSHDSEAHKDWVLQLATRLRSNSVDVLLDRWNLKLGQDLPAFMERGLSESHRILCICSESYTEKSNEGQGGVGYEKQIITAEMLENLNTNWVIPVIRNNCEQVRVPRFLKGRLYTSFEDDRLYEDNYETLLRELLDEPVLAIPPIGKNPFKAAKNFSTRKFVPSSEKYVSPATKGRVTFDYSNNNGRYSIGQGAIMFELHFSKASRRSIYVLNDTPSLSSVAAVKDTSKLESINDARQYDATSRYRNISINQLAVLQNRNGFYAAIKIIDLKDDMRGDKQDEITFEYLIQSNGSPDFRTFESTSTVE